MRLFVTLITASRFGRMLFVSPLAALVWSLLLKAMFPSLDIPSMLTCLVLLVLSSIAFLLVDIQTRGPEDVDSFRESLRQLSSSHTKQEKLLQRIAKEFGETNFERLPTLVKALTRKKPVVDKEPRLRELEQQMQGEGKKRDAVERDLRASQGELLAAKRRIASLEQDNLSLSEGVKVSCLQHEQRTSELQEALTQAESLIKRHLANIQSLNREKADLGAAVADASNQRTELEEKVIKLQRELEEQVLLNNRLENALSELSALQQEVTKLRGLSQEAASEHRRMGAALVELRRENGELQSDISRLREMSVNPKAIGASLEYCYAQVARFRAELFLITSLYAVILQEADNERQREDSTLQQHELWKVFCLILREMVPLHEILRILRRLPPNLFEVVKPKQSLIAPRRHLGASP